MTTMRADADHGPLSRSRGHHGLTEPGHEFAERGTEDWIHEAVGADRAVLVVGSDAARYAGGLARRRCQVTAVGCGTLQATSLETLAVAGEIDDLDLDQTIGERRFDVILATEILDATRDPVALLDGFRRWLQPGGSVVASQSKHSDRRPATRATLLRLFEDAGFAVARYQPVILPIAVTPPGGGATTAVARVERSLIVALPVGNLDPDWRHPLDRVLVAERDAAARHAADLARDLKTAATRINRLTDHLDRSSRREQELSVLLRLAHDRNERDNEELRSLAQRFHEALQRQEEQRKSLEDRLNRIRQSLPGRLFLALRAMAAIGRR